MQNLLILTQKVNYHDTDLGFFHKWIMEFSKYYDKVTVICLEKGEYELPCNVKVLSLGKEKITNCKSIYKFTNRMKFILRFYKYIWQERKNYDKVFVHMNKEYIVWGGIIWKIMNKKIGLWYVHKKVALSLRIAEKFADVIFTATEKSFRLPSKKIRIVGHGIDIDKFKDANKEFDKKNGNFRIITVGRISPVKDYETLIKAVEILVEDGMKVQLEIIGEPPKEDQREYYVNLQKMVKDKNLENVVKFVGPVSHKEIRKYYSADLFAHMSNTGSLDKAILEAMVSGILVLSSNDASHEILKDINDNLLFSVGDYNELAQKIKKQSQWSEEEREVISKKLQKIVIENHSLENLIKKIVFLIS